MKKNILGLLLFYLALTACDNFSLTPKPADYRARWIGTYKCNTICATYNVLDEPALNESPAEEHQIVVEKGDTDSTIVVNGSKIKIASNGNYELIKDYNAAEPHDFVRLSLWYTKKSKTDSIYFYTSTGNESQWSACRYKGQKL